MMRDFSYDKQIDVDQIMGAAMLVRRSVIEEVDWCYRIKQAGWRIVFLPNAAITHLGGRSSRQVPLKRIMVFKSMIAFFRKHRGKLATETFAVIFKIALILRNICHLMIGLVTFVIASVMYNSKRQQKAKENISLHALLLSRYLWRVITM
jgi:GT2 family glycosyltransferase